MKKKYSFLLIFAISIFSYCAWYQHPWTIKDLSSGLTTLVTCKSGGRVSLQDFSMIVQNQCNVYLCDEDGTQLYNTWYLTDNGTVYLTKEGSDFSVTTDEDKDLCIWASADPGTDVAIRFNYVEDH